MRKRNQEVADGFGFQPTLWTAEVRPAGAADDGIRLQALDVLLRKYQPPLVSFLRARFWKRPGVSNEWIEDCFHAFLLEKVIKRELIKTADRERGRFRDLLKASLSNFGEDFYRKQIGRHLPQGERTTQDGDSDASHDTGSALIDLHPRGPKAPSLAPPAVPPHRNWDADWARRTLAEALRQMKRECEEKGQRAIWLVFKRRRLEPLFLGKEAESLEETADAVRARLGEPLLARKMSELQKTGERKLRRIIRDILSAWCPDADEIDADEERLKQALASDIRRGRRPGTI